MQYATNDGESIFDIVLKTVGNLEKTYEFILANPQISNINFSFDNVLLITNYTPPTAVAPSNLLGKIKIAPTTGNVIGRDGQSVFDLCLMSTGNIGGIMQFLLDNNISNVNEDVLIGKPFTFNLDSVLDNIFYNKITTNNTVFNTGITIKTAAILQENGYYILQENGFRILL